MLQPTQVMTNLTLRTKLIAAFLLVALVPLFILGVLNERSTRIELTRDGNVRLLAHATQAAAEYDHFVTENLNAVRVEAKLPVFQEYLRMPPGKRLGSHPERKVTDTLRALSLKDHVNISSYALLDARGRDVIDSHGSDMGRDKSDRDYFLEPFSTGLPFASAVEISPSPFGETGLYFSSPVRDPNGAIIGVLAAHYRAAILQRLIRAYTGLAGEGSFAVLLDDNHVRLAHGADPDQVFKSIVPMMPARVAELQSAGRLPLRPAAELASNIPELEEGLTNAATQPYFSTPMAAPGGLSFAAAARMERLPWLVVFAQPQEFFQLPIQAQTRNTVVLGTVIAALAILAALGAVQLLAGPITRLTAVVQKITTGDLGARASAEASDEIGTLATAFNNMTASLEEQIAGLRRAEQEADASRANLQAARDDLEIRVEERTEALARSVRAIEQAREDLSASEIRFRDFASAASDWYWEMDGALRFSYFSVRFEEVTGVQPAALLGKTREETGIPDVDSAEWQNHLDDLYAHRAFRGFVHPRVKPDGGVVWLSISGIPLFDTQGGFVGFRGTGSDITDRKRMDEMLVRSERLAALGQVTATVAHELRNPLGSIRSSLAVIGRLVNKESPLVVESIGIADRSISRCNRIVSDLLDFTRVKELKRAHWPFDEWLDGVLREYEPASGISVHRALESGTALAIDDEHMRRAVINLLDNACQAMTRHTEDGEEETKGRLNVATRRVGESVELSIEDTGYGIPAHLREDVFEPLFTTKNFGAGLGLPIVKQIVEQHHGKITIDSEPERGTRVCVRLPLSLQAADADS